MDKVIDILLGKADKDFTTFLKMLQSSNNKVWTEEPEKRAKQFKEEGMCVGRRRPRGARSHGTMHLPYCPVCVCARAALQEESMHLLCCVDSVQSGYGAAIRVPNLPPPTHTKHAPPPPPWNQNSNQIGSPRTNLFAVIGPS